jgi:hypothetical protein
MLILLVLVLVLVLLQGNYSKSGSSMSTCGTCMPLQVMVWWWQLQPSQLNRPSSH